MTKARDTSEVLNTRGTAATADVQTSPTDLTAGSVVITDTFDVNGGFIKTAISDVDFYRFGAIGDGVTDDTAAVQSAFTYAISNSVSIDLGIGNFLISSAINVSNGTGLEVIGRGGTNSVITTNSATSDVFFSSTDDRGQLWASFGIESSVARTAGSYFNIDISRTSVFSELKLTGWFQAMNFSKAESGRVSGCIITDPSGAGSAMILGGAGVAGQLSGFTVENCLLRGNELSGGANVLGTYGIETYDADAIVLFNNDIGGFVDGDIKIEPLNRAANHHFIQNFFDATSVGSCVQFGGAGVKSQISMVSAWCASAGKLLGSSNESVGIHFKDEGVYSDIIIDAPRIFNNSGSGVLIEAANADINFTGGNYYSNAQASAVNKGSISYIPASAGAVGPSFEGVRCSTTVGADIIIGPNGRKYNITGCRLSSGVDDSGALGYYSANFDESANTLPSITTLQVSPAQVYFLVTGTTNISGITATFNQHQITLKFDGALVVIDAATNLSLAGNFSTTSGDTLTLICDGATWHEVTRSVN